MLVQLSPTEGLKRKRFNSKRIFGVDHLKSSV